MDSISVEQLFEHPDKLVRDAENGELGIVTKDGRPLFFVVPYDERIAREDVKVALAVRLYEQEVLSLGAAAVVAALSLSEFIDRLAALNIPVARYPAEDLEREVVQFG